MKISGQHMEFFINEHFFGPLDFMRVNCSIFSRVLFKFMIYLLFQLWGLMTAKTTIFPNNGLISFLEASVFAPNTLSQHVVSSSCLKPIL